MGNDYVVSVEGCTFVEHDGDAYSDAEFLYRLLRLVNETEGYKLW